MSGPKRYDWVVVRGGKGDGEGEGEGEGEKEEEEEKGEWVYLRDGSTLAGLLEEEVGVVPGEGEES